MNGKELISYNSQHSETWLKYGTTTYFELSGTCPMMGMECHTGKAAMNLRKHGVSFDEAEAVFLGQIAVFHTHRPDIIRIISARTVACAEWKLYE